MPGWDAGCPTDVVMVCIQPSGERGLLNYKKE